MSLDLYPSPCPSPSELASASSPTNVTASASGCGWRGDAITTAATGLPLPLGEDWGEGLFPPLADDLYAFLMESRSPDFDAFDAHVVASILGISFGEALGEGSSLSSATGLTHEQLADLMARAFPGAAALRCLAPAVDVERSADEACLFDLLASCTTSRTDFEGRLAAMIARRAQRPNHLWQDLGLRNRGELGELMTRHFKPLAMRNRQDMKWKKFFYRIICSDAAYSLCTAPSCGECDDFDHCFGEETGESLLARARRA